MRRPSSPTPMARGIMLACIAQVRAAVLHNAQIWCLSFALSALLQCLKFAAPASFSSITMGCAITEQPARNVCTCVATVMWTHVFQLASFEARCLSLQVTWLAGFQMATLSSLGVLTRRQALGLRSAVLCCAVLFSSLVLLYWQHDLSITHTHETCRLNNLPALIFSSVQTERLFSGSLAFVHACWIRLLTPFLAVSSPSLPASMFLLRAHKYLLCSKGPSLHPHNCSRGCISCMCM